MPNWYLLGLQLGVSEDELDKIEKNYPRDNDLCKVKMFGAWLRADTRATYGKLARALVTHGKRSIAEAMCTARGMEFTILECSMYCVFAMLWGWELTKSLIEIQSTQCLCSVIITFAIG